MITSGIPVCPGKVLCKTHLLNPIPHFDLEKKCSCDVSTTKKEVRQAIAEIVRQLEQVAQSLSTQEAELVEVQQTMLEETCFLEEIDLYISQGYSAEASVLRAARTQENLLRELEDEYLSARAEDMHDASHRVACLLTGASFPDLSHLNEPVIVVAEELLPSMLMSANLKNICGIIIQNGTRTSHVSILASSLDIPTLVGCADAMKLPYDKVIFLDSESGKVFYELEDYSSQQQQAAAYFEEKQRLKDYCHMPADTADGKKMVVVANIVEPLVLKKVKEQGMAGVGLFRTEFLFMNRTAPPDEEEQYQIYHLAAQTLEDKVLTIRTMDIGGDKEVDYLQLPKEENPFMGFRAIRICLNRSELFKTQLRAILRASTKGNIRIMFPMIATMDELNQALELLEQCRQELRKEKVAFDENLPVGIMVEIPSAVVMLDKMADKIQFVSIGSNDLVQYTYAADRLNKSVEYLYNFMDPAVLRLIAYTIRTCKEAGIECSLCGEMAGDAMGLAALMALGLIKFSVSPSLGLITKKRITLLNYGALGAAGKQMLNCDTAVQAVAVLRQALPEEYPVPLK